LPSWFLRSVHRRFELIEDRAFAALVALTTIGQRSDCVADSFHLGDFAIELSDICER
jgi:hypothetical protein